MFRSTPIIRWRRYNDRYLLEGSQCSTCKKLHYPKKAFCTCGSKDLKAYVFKGKGTLQTFTEITSPSEKFRERAPFCIGIVKLEEGPQISAQIADAKLADLRIGMPLEAVFRKFYASGEEGALHYGTKFKPMMQ